MSAHRGGKPHRWRKALRLRLAWVKGKLASLGKDSKQVPYLRDEEEALEAVLAGRIIAPGVGADEGPPS